MVTVQDYPALHKLAHCDARTNYFICVWYEHHHCAVFKWLIQMQLAGLLFPLVATCNEPAELKLTPVVLVLVKCISVVDIILLLFYYFISLLLLLECFSTWLSKNEFCFVVIKKGTVQLRLP